MSNYYTEANYENAIIELFQETLGYHYIYGPDIGVTTTPPSMRTHLYPPYSASTVASPLMLSQRRYTNSKTLKAERCCKRTSPSRTTCKTASP